MKSDDWVPILAAAANKRDKIGMRQATLLSWDPTTGNNTVLVAGQTFTNLPVLASGSIAMAPGDIVALQRYGNSYYIQGAIRNAGTGSLQTRSAKVANDDTRSATSFGDLAHAGPSVDAYIGRNRQCAVFLSASSTAPADEYAQMNVAVSGASTIPVDPVNIAFLGAASSDTQGSPAAIIQFTATDGLNEGVNTFTAKYASFGGATCHWRNRLLVVIPY